MHSFRGVYRHLRVVVLALGAYVVFGIPISAADIPGYPDTVQGYDSREVALLPRYCIYTQLFRDRAPGGNKLAQINRLTKEMGPTFNHMHHYCWGLMKTNRAMLLARTPEDRRSNLHYSIEEFDYVINQAPADFVLLPEILTKRGENLIRLQRAGAGLVDLQQAIRIKADYWPAYAVISDYHKGLGEVGKAREWLNKGLANAPKAKALTQRLAELEAPQGKGMQSSQRR